MWDDKALAIRIAGIVGYHDGCPPYQKENGTWVLNATNNWLLRINSNEAELDYRYKNSWKPDEINALRTVIECFILGV